MRWLITTAALAACTPSVEITDLDGRNARNNAVRVQIDPDAPCRPGVAAQEIWEAMHKQSPVTAVLVRADKDAQRRMEVMGHEVETQAAVRFCGADESAYRAKEARVMHRGYDGLFADMTEAEIVARMQDRSAAARGWVERHADKLEDM